MSDVGLAVERLRDALFTMSLGRCVLVQPTTYGTDCTIIGEATRHLGAAARAVGAATVNVSDKELDRLHDVGMRGLRFTEMRHPVTRDIVPGGVGIEHLHHLAPRLRERKWHAELWAPPAFIAADVALLLSLDVPIVIDHMALITGRDDRMVDVLVDLLKTGQIWSKLSLCRILTPLGNGDARRLHDCLVEAAPTQLLWGSDWPYIGMNASTDQPRRMLDTFLSWVDDAALRKRILVDNPADFYGFEPS